MKKLLSITLIGLLLVSLSACEPEETETTTTSRRSIGRVTTNSQPKVDPTVCQEVVSLDDDLLKKIAGVLADLFNTENTQQATQYFQDNVDRRNELELECTLEASSGKQGASLLQSCVDVLTVDDIIFQKSGEAFENIFDTSKMDAVTEYVNSVASERVANRDLCQIL